MTPTITEVALTLSSSTELSILVKATLVLAMGLAASRLARRARASRRHLLLAATFAALLALPVVVATAPGVAIELPAAGAAGPVAAPPPAEAPGVAIAPIPAGARPATAASGQWSTPSWQTVARAAWAAGALFLALSLALDLRRLGRLRREALPALELRGLVGSLAAECGVRRSVEVLLHEDVAAPLTFGAWRPAVILPANACEASEDDLRRALVHELEHVRRGDWIVQLAARAACALYWFHPLAWAAWRRLGLEAERAADDAVVQRAERTEYAEQLVSLARRMSTAHAQRALGMANRSDLSARVAALLDAGQRRGSAGLAAVVGVACVASFLVTVIGPVHAVARPVTVVQEAGARDEGPRATRLDAALYEAAADGDLSEMGRLLDAGANVNAAVDGDGSPLIGAAREGRLDAVRLLLDRGADPNMPVDGDGNPLIMAAREGHRDVVALLLDRGARVDEMVPSDENALIQAAWNGRLDVVKLLVERGADVNARAWAEPAFDRPNGEWRTPLRMARKHGHDAVVAYLRSAGARE